MFGKVAPQSWCWRRRRWARRRGPSAARPAPSRSTCGSPGRATRTGPSSCRWRSRYGWSRRCGRDRAGGGAVAGGGAAAAAPGKATAAEADTATTAPELAPGTYTGSITTGETRYLRVRLGWGRRLAYRLRLGVLDGTVAQSATLYVKLAFPLRTRGEQASGQDGTLMLGGPSRWR